LATGELEHGWSEAHAPFLGRRVAPGDQARNFLTAKIAKWAKFLYPDAFIQLLTINQFGTKLKNSSETRSFFAHFASFAVNSKLSLLSSSLAEKQKPTAL
jgi:hypothetical protein